MPFVREFDTETVQNNNIPDIQYTLNFPQPFPTRPRLPHGFRKLDVGNNANISVRSSLHYFTKDWADWHVTALNDTTLHAAVDNVFVLEPTDEEFLTGKHMRHIMANSSDPASVRVKFHRPFSAPPKVVVFFNYIDVDKTHNWRIKTTATEIDANGFTLNIDTWGDTIMHAAQACWIAYPANREGIFSTSVNTTDVRPINQPRAQQSKSISFDRVQFRKNPSVFVGLNYLDIDCRANLRINAYVDGVTRTGLVWHIDSWADTVLYAGGASIIAFT